MKLTQVVNALESVCPPSLAVEGDNIGLHVGDPEAEVSSIAVALDADAPTIETAVANEIDLLIVHHPMFRESPKALVAGDPDADRINAVIRGGMAVYSMHTNFDSVRGGVSDVLAERLGLAETRVLAPSGGELKLVVFVPPASVEGVLMAMTQAGAGTIGAYTGCSFAAAGKGRFTAPAGVQPAAGKAGEANVVDEMRLEMSVAAERLGEVVRAMAAAHPYEEVAYDVYSLVGAPRDVGLGRVGRLVRETTLAALAAEVADRLGVETTKYAGDPGAKVVTVAVCGGSGGGMIDASAGAGAEALVCGDIRYHDAQEGLALGLGLVDAGHDGTEAPAVGALAAMVERGLRSVGYTGSIRHYEAPRALWRRVGEPHG